MAELRTVRIGDLGRVVTGKTPPSSQPELFGELHPFLTPTDIDGLACYIEPGRFLSPEGRDYQHRLMLPAHAVCVVCIGATIGKVCMTNRPSFTNQQINSIIVNAGEHDPFFVYHLMTTLRDELKSNAGGAATPIINKTAFSEIEVRVPPLPEQRRIAGILSAYDELMENSQRRIRILESMARALYREWFIHFRFPGHENHPRVASALGEIPEGWEAIRFERLLASMTGGDWGSEHPEDRETEAVVVVRGTDFDEVAYGGQLRAPVRYIKPSSLVSRALKVGDVIIENSINAKSRSVGTTLLVDKHVLNRLGQDAIAASFCKVLRPHDQMIAPLIHLHARHLREDARMEYYQNVAANGIANFQAQKFAKEEHLVLPADEDERSRLIAPIRAVLQNVASLASRLANLRRTRDLLLPRLLSGHIALDELEAA
jgi:type I restriction enzyme S subunit